MRYPKFQFQRPMQTARPGEPSREIAVRCPVTGLPVATGERPATSPIRPIRAKRTLRVCPACGQSHEWTLHDAWLIAAVTEAAPEKERDTELL